MHNTHAQAHPPAQMYTEKTKQTHTQTRTHAPFFMSVHDSYEKTAGEVIFEVRVTGDAYSVAPSFTVPCYVQPAIQDRTRLTSVYPTHADSAT